MHTSYAGSLQVRMVGTLDANPTSKYNTLADESAGVAGWPAGQEVGQPKSLSHTPLTHTALTHTSESAKPTPLLTLRTPKSHSTHLNTHFT